jgi:hypothetical protein
MGFRGDVAQPISFVPTQAGPYYSSTAFRITLNNIYKNGNILSNIRIELNQTQFLLSGNSSSTSALGISFGWMEGFIKGFINAFGSNIAMGIVASICSDLPAGANCEEARGRLLAECLNKACCEFKKCSRISNTITLIATAIFGIIGFLLGLIYGSGLGIIGAIVGAIINMYFECFWTYSILGTLGASFCIGRFIGSYLGCNI